MPGISNWAGTHTATPAVLYEASSPAQVAAVLSDPDNYPSPVRVYGSNHSTTDCALTDGGTMIRLVDMDQILELTDDYVRVQAGAYFIDVSRHLEEQGKEFYVNLQIGNATMGSLACCASKDASYQGIFGQANSYCTSVTLVKTDGSIVTVDESQPDLLQAVRSSYSLLGIVIEATFKIRKIRPISIRHRSMPIDKFLEELPQLVDGPASIAYYLFPWINRVIVQERTPTEIAGEPNRLVWKVRNWTTAHIVPLVARFTSHLPGRWFRNCFAGAFYWSATLFLSLFLHARKTVGAGQTMFYKHDAGWGRFTFSLWGFPISEFDNTLRAYIDFIKSHYDATGYRSFMLTVGYHVCQDNGSLFSYSSESDVITIDPTSSGEPGWQEFVQAFNEFASDHGARPLFNQTPYLQQVQVQKAFGHRLEQFRAIRKQWDPADRLLNRYFRELLE